MKASKGKLQLAMARACMNVHDISEKAEMPQPSVKNVISGRSVKPATLGRIARALGVDVAELLEQED